MSQRHEKDTAAMDRFYAWAQKTDRIAFFVLLTLFVLFVVVYGVVCSALR
jgi:hypothetical protein